MIWLKFKHGTLEKQYNVTTILAPFLCAFTFHHICTKHHIIFICNHTLDQISIWKKAPKLASSFSIHIESHKSFHQFHSSSHNLPCIHYIFYSLFNTSFTFPNGERRFERFPKSNRSWRFIKHSLTKPLSNLTQSNGWKVMHFQVKLVLTFWPMLCGWTQFFNELTRG
jgi:hypothetical protein